MNSNYSFSIVCGMIAASNMQLGNNGMFILWMVGVLISGWYGDYIEDRKIKK